MTSAVPAFYYDNSQPFGVSSVDAASFVQPANPALPAGSDSTNSSPGGATASGSISNDVVDNPPSPEGGTGNLASVQESGQVSSVIGGPVQPSSTGVQGLYITVSHSHTDQVYADANGPYYIGPNIANETTTATSNGFMNWVVQNTDGTPATGTMTVTFSVSISGYDASGPNGTQRFDRSADLAIETNYFNIGISAEGPGVSVTDPSGTTIYKSDTTFESTVNPPVGGGTAAFEWTQTFPIQSSELNVKYLSRLVSGPDGTFYNETAGATPNFGWKLSFTVNPS